MFVIDSLHVYKVTKFEIFNVLILKDMHILPTGECIHVYWNTRTLYDPTKNIKSRLAFMRIQNGNQVSFLILKNPLLGIIKEIDGAICATKNCLLRQFIGMILH